MILRPIIELAIWVSGLFGLGTYYTTLLGLEFLQELPSRYNRMEKPRGKTLFLRLIKVMCRLN